mgnify:CR=1 FL=1
MFDSIKIIFAESRLFNNNNNNKKSNVCVQ